MSKFLNQRLPVSFNNYEVMQQVRRLNYGWKAKKCQLCCFLEVLSGIVAFSEVNYLVTHFSRSGLYPKTHLPTPQSGGLDGRL